MIETDRSSGAIALSEPEQQVAALVAHGLTTPEIAGRLGVSSQTVLSHLSRIRMKLKLDSRLQIAIWAQQHLGEAARIKR